MLKHSFYPLSLQKSRFWPPCKKNGKSDSENYALNPLT